ncbi:MAG: glycoside hydrolase family 19 protein [Bacteroidota bacterium]
MKRLLLSFKIVAFLFAIYLNSNCFSQNTNLDNLLNVNQWDSLFPKRAGTYGAHPQGYTTDFYSYNNLKQAVNEMSDYLVQIRVKKNVWGQLITVTKKSTNTAYIYSDVESWWHSNPTPETVVIVDFKDFINRSSDINNRRELAAFLANISKETTGGWTTPIGGGSEGDYAKWGLYFVHEVGYNSSNSAGVYSQADPEYTPNPNKGYYGRGPIQLSWNYNYGQFSKFLFNDKNILLNNPDSVQRDGVLAFKSAIWFWMMPQCPKPSCHQAMQELWVPAEGEYTSAKMYKKGFAHTNNIINGGLECRTTSSPAFTAKVAIRSELYKYYLKILGFSSNEIALENANDYTTLCYESNTNAMQDYQSCELSDVTTNIPSIQEQKPVVFPNPTSSFVNIVHNQTINKIELIDINEGKIWVTIIDSEKADLNLSDLKFGFYLMRIYSGANIYSEKIIIE